jgi:hypothetical protein
MFKLELACREQVNVSRFNELHGRLFMTKAGGVEYFRRAIALALCVTGAVYIQRPVLAALLLLSGLAFYLLLPAAKRPPNALVYDRLPAIVLPDVVGFLLAGIFLAMPFWIGPGPGSPSGMVHPVAIMTWPLAIGSLGILVVTAHYASFWLCIADDGLQLASAGQTQFVPYSKIVRVEPYRRGLPRWLRALAPFLAVTGHYTAAGAVTLARDSTGIRLRLEGGPSIVICRDAFEEPYRQTLQALKAHGVAFKSNRSGG